MWLQSSLKYSLSIVPIIAGGSGKDIEISHDFNRLDDQSWSTEWAVPILAAIFLCQFLTYKNLVFGTIFYYH